MIGGGGGKRTAGRLVAALLVLLGVTAVGVTTDPGEAEAAVVRSFAPRFRTNERGDVYAIGNTLVTCVASTACSAAQAGTGNNTNNNDFVGAFVDVDGNATTSNSSQATLTLPAGGSVLWAGLYWAGSAAAGTPGRGTIRLAGPSGTYATISGNVTTGAAVTTGGLPYAGFADVTSSVQASGTYTVGGLTTTVGATNSRGGWSLVVVVRDPAQPLRNLSVFDGYAEINSSAADSVVTTTVSGFLTPVSGTVTARVGAVTSEGDLGLTGDQFSVNGTVLSNTLNPATNFWNSSVSRLGTRISAKNPDHVNQMGFDVDYLQLPNGVIGNNQTSATLRFTTGGESYEPIALFSAIDIYEPNMSVTKTAAKVGPGSKLNPGDTIQYTVEATSTGSEPAASTVLTDALPAGVSYVPGSLTIDGTTVTDAAGDDRAEYSAGSRTVTARLGTGANGTSGGSVAVGTTFTLRFRVTVDASPAPGLQIVNQATAAYASPTTATTYRTLSDDPDVNGAPNPTAFDVNDPPVANPVTATTSEDSPTTVDLAPSASDPDDTTLTFTLVSGPPAAQGTVTCNAAGACTYTPAANFSGTTSFTYRVTDPGGIASTSTVTITVNAVNDAPVAVNDAVTTNEDTPAELTVTTNDTDIDGGALTVSAFTQGTTGTVTCVAPAAGAGPCTTGALRYVPNADATGTDAFSYVVSDGNGGTATATVAVTIIPVNDTPVATGATVTTREDTPSVVNVFDGDTDKDGDAVRLLSFTQPAAGTGTVSCTANAGPCTYTPPTNFSGTTSFTYTISDRAGAGGLTSTATINVTVTPVNDFPVGAADLASTAEDIATTIDVLVNDSDVDGDALRVASFTQPARGTVRCVAPAGSTGPCDPGTGLRYTPDANFSGSDPFTYDLADGNGGQVTVAVGVTVTPVNDPPTAVNDAVTTGEDMPIQIAVLANDTDIEGNALTVASVSQPPAGSGSATCSASSCTFTPAGNFTGTATFGYTVSDGNGGTSSATVTVTVAGVNDAPVATPNTVPATEDTTTAPFELIADDTDVDDPDASLVITALSTPTQGTVTCGPLPGRGPCTYTPFPNASVTDSFTYTIRDPGGLTSTATVTVEVAAVNDPPVAPDSAYQATEDTPVAVDLTRNVTDIDSTTLTYTVVTPPSSGTLSCPTPSTCTFDPAADFNGSVSFTYLVTDGSGGADTATVTVTVVGVNDPPTATPELIGTPEDTAITFDPRSGDSDPDGDPLLVTAVSVPTNGTATCGTTSCTYTPNANFNGTDTFTYTVSDGRGGTSAATVTVGVSPVNDPPVAVDDAASTAEDAPVTFDVRTNDRDVDGDTLAVAVTIAPPAAAGTVSCTGAGACTFTSTPDFAGATSFTYEVSDGNGGTAAAVARITVDPINDPPVAGDDGVTTAEDTTSAAVDVLADDTDVDTAASALRITAVSVPANGTVTCGTLPGVGPCLYTPNANFNGTDSFTYTVSDGTASDAGTVVVTVTPVNDAPTADADSAVTDEDTPVTIDVADGDADLDGPALTWSVATQPADGTVTCTATGACTYTPNANFGGLDSFTYTVSDGTASTTATVTVLVRAVNDPPVAVDDVATTDEDTTVDIDLVTDDTDPDGDTLAITTITQPANGTVRCVTPAGGTGPCTSADVRYTPNRNFTGTDTFTYLVGDGSGASDAGTVTVTVDPLNDPPLGSDRTVTTAEDTGTGPIDVVAGATDVDGDTVTLDGLLTGPPPAQGTVVCDPAAGTCTFTPAPNFNGTSSFTVTLADGNGGSDVVTITVDVTATNDPPVADPDSAAVDEDGSVTLDPRIGDVDPDGDALAITAGTRATANGSVTCTTTACTYTPRANFNGTDTFTYDVSDPSGATVTGTVTVAVAPVNDAPVAVDTVRATPEDTAVEVPLEPLLRPELDPDGDDLVLTFTPPPASLGTFACPGAPPYATGTTCTFTPTADTSGPVVIAYEISDGNGGTDAGTITIDVGATNDSPTPAGDAVSVVEDTPTPIDVLVNDTDPDPGDALTVVPVTDAPTRGGGTVTCTTTACTYTPPPDFNGADSFTYQVADAAGTLGTASVTITVTPVNDPPNRGDGSGTTDEDTPLTVPVFFVLANDTDPDPGDTLTAITFTPPPSTEGSVVCRRDGVPQPTGPYLPSDLCTFTPAPDFNGTTAFTYTTQDGAGAQTTSVITVLVQAVNDAPLAGADAQTTAEDTAATVAVLDNDGDVDLGDSVTVVSFSQPANGAVRCVSPAGELGPCDPGGLRYIPNANFAGTDTLTYVIADEAGTTASATVTMTVTAVNDPPVAAGFAVETDEDVPVDVSPADGDIDIDSPPPVLVGVGTPANGGSVTCDFGTGVCTYTPAPGFSGTDTFTYTIEDDQGLQDVGTVTVTVNPVNDLPVAVDDTATVTEDGFVDITPLGNDTDADGDALVLLSNSAPTNGTVTCDPATGTCRYRPFPNSTAADSFTYTVRDPQGGTATATVSITVTAVNDPPVAGDLAITLAEGTAVTIPLLAGATDVDDAAGDLEVTGIDPTSPPFGTWVCDRAAGTCAFDPGPDAFGSFEIDVTIADPAGATTTRTITVTVTPVNDPPQPTVAVAETTEDTDVAIDVLAGATDPDPGDTVTLVGFTQPGRGEVDCDLASGICTYAPAPNSNGADSFTYTVTDGNGAEVTRTVVVTVTPVNDAPTAGDVELEIDEDTPVPLDLLAGADDIDQPTGTPLSATVITDPTLGTLDCEPDGTCTYQPAPGVAGTDTFVVRVADAAGASVERTFTIEIAPINDVPDADDDAATTDEDAPVAIAVLANDGDADEDALTIASFTSPAKGTVTCVTPAGGTGPCTGGSLRYVPNPNTAGPDTFTYTVVDGQGGTATATVTLDVRAVNDPPTSSAGPLSTPEDTPLTFDPLEGATDVDGDEVVLLGTPMVVTAGGGTIACAAGSCTFTPGADVTGAVTIRYTIGDGNGGSTVVTRTVAVIGAEDPPVPALTEAAVDEDAVVDLDLLAGATDPDGDVLSVVAVTQPANGTLVLQGDGTYRYAPAPNFFGTDTFTYTITDGTGNDVTTTVTVTVRPQPDAPTPGSGSASTPEDVPINVPVSFILANDTDPDGDAFEAISFQQPAPGTGTAACFRNGQPQPSGPYLRTDICRFTPAPNYVGETSFDYTVRDSTGRTGTATITVIVTAVDDGPTVLDETTATDEDEFVLVDVITNDSDVDDAQADLDIIAVTQPQNGTVDCGPLPGRGPCRYTPAANFNGTDSFGYVVAGPQGTSASGTVTITVTPVDDAPLASDRTIGTIEDEPVDFNGLDGVIDPDGTPVRLVGVSQPANGEVVCDLDTGACTYTPNPNFNGTDPVTVTVGVIDATGAESSYTVTFDVAAIDDAPVGVADELTIDEDSPAVPITVLANDSDPEGRPLAIVSNTAPALGTVDCQPGGPCTYRPNPDASGTDSFSYIVSDGTLQTAVVVTITITPVPDPPVVADDEVTTDEDTEVVITVLGNDTDPDGGRPGQVTIVRPPTHGTLRPVGTTGELAYVPDPDYAGLDDFEYQACDPEGACDTATVSITVVPVPDDPQAEDLTGITTRDETVAVSPLDTASDPDGDLDESSLELIGNGPLNGTVAQVGAQFVYTPNAGFVGTDQFGYRICDERGVCVEQVVNIEVLAPDEPPVAVDDTAAVPTGSTVVIDVLTNDRSDDADDLDPASVEVVDGPEGGTVTVDAGTGAISYTPAPGFSGTDTFAYEVCDLPGEEDEGEGAPAPTAILCTTATVRVTVDPAVPTPTTTTTAATTTLPPTTTTAPPATTAPTSTTTTPSTVGPGGGTVTAPPVSRPRPPGGPLPSTGTTIATALFVGAGLVVVGTMLRSRRRRPIGS